MDWALTATLLMSVLKAALGFNIDPVAWKTFSQPAAAFGYQVVQRENDLLVSAPLEQYSENGRGQIYQCTNNGCQHISIPVPEIAVNMSLGLTMTADPATNKTLACGPTIPKDCKSITTYNGMCFQLTTDEPPKVEGSPLPSSIEECRIQADIAFLLDGSGSVSSQNFTTMKNFVIKLVKSFEGQDVKFSITQFAWDPEIHFYFNTFNKSGSWETEMNTQINQFGGGTNTAKAIRHVVENVFVSWRGSRENVKKVLIVITDGESGDRDYLSSSTTLADKKEIVRFAIGVGEAFSHSEAKKELDTIASSPSWDHVFKEDSFTALDKIRDTLQAKIFAIEGSQSTGESLKMQMAQEGFRAAYTPQGIQLAIVGANEWKGGYVQYNRRGDKRMSFEPSSMEPDSYLGYSMAVANTKRGTLTIVGAPRYQHRGVVMAVHSRRSNNQMIDPYPWQYQTGEYFGAEVCSMDINSDGYSDLILISAPMFVEHDREGIVYVCGIVDLNVECHFDSPLVLRGESHDQARFGAALAPLPDLNADGFSDLAVGAPLENDGQGSIYIYQGDGGRRVNPEYSQRISGSEVKSGLKFFGMSISQSSFDRNGDDLPDLAVSSKGSVFLLRSRPIVMVEASITFTPNQIPNPQNPDCSKDLKCSARICFTMTRHSALREEAQATINYTITLDATRKSPNNRAYIFEKQREETRSIRVSTTSPGCYNLNFFVQACPDDARNEIKNELKYTFQGLPLSTDLRPSLASQAQRTTFHPIGFEINCGTDNKCVDDLKVDFNFTNSKVVQVGIDESLDVTVSVENRGENSYNSRVILTYPVGLFYRKFTSLQGRIQCDSVDSEDGVSRGKTECSVDKPIFKSNTKVFFIVSYGIEPYIPLDSSIFITTNASSQNQQHASLNEVYKRKDIGVKYSIFVTMESLLSYTNFTFGNDDLQKPVEQSLKVTNNVRALNLTVMIKVPVKLGDKDIWANLSSLQIPDCKIVKDEEPLVKDFVPQIQNTKVVDCLVAWCRLFQCTRFMGRLETKDYEISTNLSSGWIEQIGLQSAKFLLTGTASLDYDRDQYIFFSTGSNHNPPVQKIEIDVEVYPEPDFTKEIIGGSLGGLAFLALLTAGLYKAGFFKSKYKDLMNENEEAGGPEPDGDASGPE